MVNTAKSRVPKGCDCSALDASEADFKETSMPLDDTGVYFEPAEESLFREQFQTKPFHIFNPIKVTKTKRSKIKESVSNKNFSIHSIGLVKDETVFQDRTNEERRISPTYLDLEIDGETISSGNGRKISLIENLASTERSLEDCLDLQVLNFTRKHGLVENFKEFWETRNLKVYEHLSDLDLTNMIHQYCRQPEFIVKESLLNIMRTVPKKNIKNVTNVDSERMRTPRFDNDSNGTFIPMTSIPEYEVPRMDPTLVYGGTTELTTSYFDTNIDHLLKAINITDTEYTTYSLNTTPAMDLMTSVIEYSDDSLNGSLVETVPNVTHSTESTLNIYDSPNITTVVHEYINKATILDLDTMPSEVFYTIYNETGTNIPENKMVWEYTSTDSMAYNTLNESIISDHDISTTTVSVIHPENRDELKETEIIIPKIITKELINDKIQSYIDGYEILSNNDFTKDRDASTADDSMATDYKSIFETTTDKYSLSDDNYISGNLYFGSAQELVPVRILQSEEGKINLAINGDTLCDKLIKIHNKSRLLTTLCKCVQTNMVQNNSS